MIGVWMTKRIIKDISNKKNKYEGDLDTKIILEVATVDPRYYAFLAKHTGSYCGG